MIACSYGAAAPFEILRFSVPEGRVLNEFYRQGSVAAHVVLTPGFAPRIVIAFPAGNSGAALWFAARAAPVLWQPAVEIEAETRELPGGDTLRGVAVEVTAIGGPVSIRQVIAGSVRTIREYEDLHVVPPEVLAVPQFADDKVTWHRRRIDGAPGYFLSIEVRKGAVERSETGSIEFLPEPDGRLDLRIRALTGDEPLTPIDENDLLKASAGPDAQLRRVLAYLSYREKLLAGSWRFATYFGRDTLMSLRLLAPVLLPEPIEAGLGAVLERLDESGEVAHEEDIGEYAVLRRLRAASSPDDAPLYDYKMIDDDFMLAPVAAEYLLDSPAGRVRAAAFLASEAGSGETNGSALARNLRFVVAAAAPFAQSLDWRRLIALKSGQYAGNWRDSEEGLGGGRYAYDVNGVFVPAALEAVARLRSSGLLRQYFDAAGDATIAKIASMAEIWRREAPRHFDVDIASDAARVEVTAYARAIDLDPARALAELDGHAVRFRAVSLDAHGRPVPVLNSDEAFALLFLDVDSAEAERIVSTLMRPFPAGLLTDVGLLVANPAYAATRLEPAFDRNRYHGTVIWSWQQAMLAAGIERQLRRGDLTNSARAELIRAQLRLREVIEAATAVRGSELWSWSQDGGAYRVEPFGQHEEHETESNAAQLWSTVHLARSPD
ncbi:MAG: hypothetical protein ACRES3_07355 [Steroidobacteraceae bacterium]